MARTAFDKPVSGLDLNLVLALLGLGTYWAWIDSVFFSAVLFGSFPHTTRIAYQSHLIAQAAALAATGICIAAPKHARRLLESTRFLAVTVAVGSLGTVASFYSATQETGWTFVAANAMLGAVMGLLPLFWGVVLSRERRDRAALAVCGSIVAACLATIAIARVETFGRLLVVYLLLPFGLLCFAVLSRGMRDGTAANEVPASHEPCEDGTLPIRTLFASCWRLLLVLLVASFAFGALQNSYRGFELLDFDLVSQAQILGRGAVALVVFVAAGTFGRTYHMVYRAGLLLMIAAFMAALSSWTRFPTCAACSSAWGTHASS